MSVLPLTRLSWEPLASMKARTHHSLPFTCPPNDVTTAHVTVSEMGRYEWSCFPPTASGFCDISFADQWGLPAGFDELTGFLCRGEELEHRCTVPEYTSATWTFNSIVQTSHSSNEKDPLLEVSDFSVHGLQRFCQIGYLQVSQVCMYATASPCPWRVY